ncbi:hypothetical protein FIBSPDRAFT_916594 [Athelia psychrophila]|uniref:Auxin efflux carrier n=1 Tax=Athelia psychrophila TaxID=1759441 RepID=A0A166UQ28_9AGAM|nr:hypothetical protein FIBSPDRAFT_916594 [Fibularhizoctonia sp. CBS 109695]
MLSAGQLIWASCRPLIRLALCAGSGFAITKADIFPQVAAQGAGQIILNITLPCLMFSKIVPAFDASNIKALGPLVLVAILYEIIGVVIAWTVKQFFWVPHRFRFGILVAGGWGNYGDIPTSVVMSITGAAPFNGASDQTLSVAYISAFILVFFMTLFPLGGHAWIAMDFSGPDIENEEVQETMRAKQKSLLSGAWARSALHTLRYRGRTSQGVARFDLADQEDVGASDSSALEKAEEKRENNAYPRATPAPKHVSFYHDDHEAITSATETVVVSPPISMYAGPSRLPSPTPSLLPLEKTITPGDQLADDIAHARVLNRREKTVQFTLTFLRSLLAPGSSVIIIALIIALVPTLKALFVAGVPGTHIPNAPDGLPPLNFILDTTTFIGAASVPLGLVSLGSALARLKVPRGQWGQLPIGAICGLAVGKVLIMPVLGVLICEGLTRVGVIDKEDKVLQFVCIFFSCLPTATTQVYLTQVYSGTGSAEHLSAFLIPQYILMFISMTGLTAYSIQYLF